jgi:hypothetical protein
MPSSLTVDLPRPGSHRRHGALLGILILTGVAGCGGLATSLEPEDSEASVEIPPRFDILELRQLYEAPASGDTANGCEYAARIEINMTIGTAASATCEGDSFGVHYAMGAPATLTSAQRTAVEQAYLQIRSSSADRCTNRAFFTLAVNGGRGSDRHNLLLADDDHTACPAPGVPSTRFVSGLSELYAELTQLLGASYQPPPS